jgi:hypothetical protein
VVLPWFILIHTTALVGLIFLALPGWRVLVDALGLAWIGGIGTTVCYHRRVGPSRVAIESSRRGGSNIFRNIQWFWHAAHWAAKSSLASC